MMKRERRSLPVSLAALAMFCMALPAAGQEPAVVPTRVIYPGQSVTADALSEITLRTPARGIIVRTSDEIEGKVARRTLLPGRLIPEGSVRDPYLVETGSAVTVTFVHGGLTISTLAVPLQPGAAGDLIKLRNVDSGAVFSGIVLDNGTVRVGAT